MIKSDLEEILDILEKWDFYGTISREKYRIKTLRFLNEIWIK